jgi:hypothetical protein
MRIKIILLVFLLFANYYSKSQEDQDQFIALDFALNMNPSGKLCDSYHFSEVSLPSFNIDYRYFFNDVIILGSHIGHVQALNDNTTDKISMTPLFVSLYYLPAKTLLNGYYGIGTGICHLDYNKDKGKDGIYWAYEFEFGLQTLSLTKFSLHIYIRYSIVKTDLGGFRYFNGGIGLMYRL